MYHGKEIYLAIKKHLNSFGLNETEMFSPPDLFSERYLRTTYGEMLAYRKAIRNPFVCLTDIGEDLNPNALTLYEFMKDNSHLYTHPFNHNVSQNCEMLENRIKEIENLCLNEIMAKIDVKRTGKVLAWESLPPRIVERLKQYTIEDFRNQNISFS
jgi:hypothetical protein